MIQKTTFSIFCLCVCFLFNACQQATENSSTTSNTKEPVKNVLKLTPESVQDQLQAILIKAKDGDIIQLPAGTFSFKRALSLNDTPNIHIKGQGKDKTILSFKDQIEGAEGLIIKGAKNIKLEDFTVQDTKGDAIKIQGCENVTMRGLNVTWTGGKLSTNGAYGLYPVTCTNVLMEKCEASYAMDAGIYVGQSNNVIVRNCYAHNNVAGIEIENSINGEVYNNKMENNTGGLLIFDMPDLPQLNGSNFKIYDNIVENNNEPNFSAEGIVVNILPPGTGMLLMAFRDLEVYNNTIKGHKSFGMGITSWLFTQRPFKNKNFDPFCSNLNIYDNKILDTKGPMDNTTDFGKLFTALFKGEAIDVVTDGIFNPAHFGKDGQLIDGKKVCLRNNGEVKFANLNAGKGGKPEQMIKNMDDNMSIFDCTIQPLDTKGHDSWLTMAK